jgi:hypothetical protein
VQKPQAVKTDTKEVVLATYAHFMPDDDDRRPGDHECVLRADRDPCALIMPGDRHE